MSTDNFDTNESVKNTILQFQNGLNWIKINCQRLKFFVQVEIFLHIYTCFSLPNQKTLKTTLPGSLANCLFR